MEGAGDEDEGGAADEAEAGGGGAVAGEECIQTIDTGEGNVAGGQGGGGDGAGLTGEEPDAVGGVVHKEAEGAGEGARGGAEEGFVVGRRGGAIDVEGDSGGVAGEEAPGEENAAVGLVDGGETAAEGLDWRGGGKQGGGKGESEG